MAGPCRAEGSLEESRGLARQLRQLALQCLELTRRVARGPAREQEIDQLEARDDVHRSPGDDPAQQALPVRPGERREGV